MREENSPNKAEETQLDAGSYEIIRERLSKENEDLRKRLVSLNEARREVFGTIETKLVGTDRISTQNNCLSRDIIAINEEHFLFGYNVFMGLKKETQVEDVFSCYAYNSKDHLFQKEDCSFLDDENFKTDFANLYKYYKGTQFIKFAEIGPFVFMVFQVGKTVEDVKTFKWTKLKGALKYVDNRSDHEFVFPQQHEFDWKRCVRDMHRSGVHPHISIEDRLFVETINGDLTIKVEDNTNIGRGIYSEEVEDKDQTLDDAEIYFAVLGNLIILKIKPYQEEKFRYILYNEKIQDALRIDALENSCVLLPDNQGIIFAKGYYIQTGEFKLFDNQLEDTVFEKRLASPNGEDFLYVFYQKNTGAYALLSYNLIGQEVLTPIICHGYSIFENGDLIYFKAEEEQKKHHLIQIWQTPFHSPNKSLIKENQSFLFKIGNKDIVRAMAEINEIQKLISKEDSYANLYVDLVKKATDVLDSYHWLSHEEAHFVEEPLLLIKESASSAIEEFEKVVRIRRNTKERSKVVEEKANEAMSKAQGGNARSIHEYIERLSLLRIAKGEVLSMKDLRYIDLELVDNLEARLEEISALVSQHCVRFLLRSEALNPYREKVSSLQTQVEEVSKVMEAKRLEEEVLKVSGDLEMLIEIVSNLKIEDSTHSTKIIESISSIYAQFNQIISKLRKKRKTLLGKEGQAEFASQMKLINQGLSNYLDISDSPDKCDDYLNKLMVQIEELEAKFVEFDEFLEKTGQKREEIFNAFESKKVALLESRNKKTHNLQKSAERIISGIGKRLLSLNDHSEINAYYASDIMVSKVRDLANSLLDLGDSVKSDDVLSKLKFAYEDAIRQLRDKKELFVDGKDIIKFGNHHFNVNTQSLDLTMVLRDDDMYYHLTGTNFFEKVGEKEFAETRDVWTQNLISENQEVYRSEFLAFQIFRELEGGEDPEISIDQLSKSDLKHLLEFVQSKMEGRFEEGYIKGVHDHDATLILSHLLQLYKTIGLLRFDPEARVIAMLWWEKLVDEKTKELWETEFRALRSIAQAFNSIQVSDLSLRELALEILNSEIEFQDKDFLANEAAEFLYHLLLQNQDFIFSQEAWQLMDQIQVYLKKSKSLKQYNDSLKAYGEKPLRQFEISCNWLNNFIQSRNLKLENEVIKEAAVLLMMGAGVRISDHKIATQIKIEGFVGDHSQIKEGNYRLQYNSFHRRLHHFCKNSLVKFAKYKELKNELLEKAKLELRLQEFQPRVLSSFVRNKLIDEVYLPLIGDNLAKQIGAAGDSKRTDLMGMLLLISPPGYGKTSLMEYVASRLGLIFMKINGPAIGHDVKSIDPSSATNSASKEELEKLNLAFEMGDNVMIYLDDIQHCSAEFLQKFISLCDGQRKIEGVYKGRSKTYDFRGKKVAVIMAGNPYTESGDKFQIPDMLANRADIYNLGDIIGGKDKVFELSYIENALSSNNLLQQLKNKSQKDIYTLINEAQNQSKEKLSLEDSHSPEEIKDYLSVLTKVAKVRDIILKVNQEYIYSAGQADEYRTEPSFKLQGSYRNMNKIVEKLSAMMNDDELETLILSHYENESQTLTQGAEFNFLKFKELYSKLNDEETVRKEQILKIFEKGQRMRGLGTDKMAMVLDQMEKISSGLAQIASSINGQQKG
tara:strand:- start:374 stop:5287 length:4914 start_codon:yes stop_codon:yes gene_type:complete